MGGRVVHHDVEFLPGILRHETAQEGAEVGGVQLLREHEVPIVRRGIERAEHVEVLALPLHQDRGLGTPCPPHPRDCGRPLHGTGIVEEEVVPPLRALDAAPEGIEKSLLAPGVGQRGHRAGAEEDETLAPEHPQHGTG